MHSFNKVKVLVTSGPTRERIDPVRYISNNSSGKQGHAIAAAFAAAGAEVTLVSGPVSIPDPAGVKVVKVESAIEMLAACEAALPVGIAVCAAAVADFRPEHRLEEKLKKEGREKLVLELVKNPDILAALSGHPSQRPGLVIGFAAETSNLLDYARKKQREKNCDWILANDVSPGTGVVGGERNTILLVARESVEHWEAMSKQAVAERLLLRITQHSEKRAWLL